MDKSVITIDAVTVTPIMRMGWCDARDVGSYLPALLRRLIRYQMIIVTSVYKPITIDTDIGIKRIGELCGAKLGDVGLSASIAP